MGLIQCPDCGREVSDKAKNCVHCGSPLKEENGIIHIKCCNIDGNPYKVKISNAKTDEEIIKIPQKAVATFEITEDTTIKIKYPMLKAITCDLKYEGVHYYHITLGSGFLRYPKLLINKVTFFDSE